MPPNNLPVLLSSFVGRESLLAELAARLDSSRLLTLTGPGGCGKTRLAMELGRQLLVPTGESSADQAEMDLTNMPRAAGVAGSSQPAAPVLDGVWLAELGALRDSSLVPRAVASVLRLREEPGVPLIATLTEAVGARQILLLLDNCEHLVEGCARLAETMLSSCPHLRILATSRLPLGLAGEVRYPVPSLGVPPAGPLQDMEEIRRVEAVRLFAERAVALAPGFALTPGNAQAVGELCRRLDGLPLALELAAARVPHLPVRELLARLDRRLQLLTGGQRTALPRQQTLRATLDWSYDLLSAPERTLLRRMAVFAGGFTLDAAEAVGGDGQSGDLRPNERDRSAMPGDHHPGTSAAETGPAAPSDVDSSGDTEVASRDVLDLLARLVDQSLVTVVVPATAASETLLPPPAARYRLLETTRAYAWERLVAAGEAEAMQERHAAHYLAWAEREAALEAAGTVPSTFVARLAAEADNVRAALTWLVGRGDSARGWRLATVLSRLWYALGHFAEGRDQLAALLSLPRPAGPDSSVAQALFATGALAYAQGDYEAARTWQEESLVAFRALGDRERAAHALSSLGVLARERGAYASARSLLEEGLAIYRDLGERPHISGSYVRLGELAQMQGDYDRAQCYFGLSLQCWPDPSTRPSRLYFHVGTLALDRGDLAAARAWLGEGLRLQWDRGKGTWLPVPPRGEGTWPWLHSSLSALACLDVAEGQPERAFRLAGAAAAQRGNSGAALQPSERGRYERWMAAARRQVGEVEANAAWKAGQAMAAEEAIALALTTPAQGPATGETAAAPVAGPAAARLTRREREVALLIVRGQTDRQIAQALGVTEDTIGGYAKHLFRKLGVRTRAEVAAWAVATGGTGRSKDR